MTHASRASWRSRSRAETHAIRLWTAVTGSSVPDVFAAICALSVAGALITLATIVVFRSSERRAWDRGLLDRTTGS